jgi:hypothetical protein
MHLKGRTLRSDYAKHSSLSSLIAGALSANSVAGVAVMGVVGIAVGVAAIAVRSRRTAKYVELVEVTVRSCPTDSHTVPSARPCYAEARYSTVCTVVLWRSVTVTCRWLCTDSSLDRLTSASAQFSYIFFPLLILQPVSAASENTPLIA